MMYTIAFVGNPNVGKSAWINALTNANFKVGNWPGVTVEKKEAYVTWNKLDLHIIDLPGTYSLQPSDNEEDITANFLLYEHIDMIVNVVDASNLQNNLLLTLMLRELQIPMLVIFNFMDEVEKYHIQLEITKLSRRLQITILPYSAFDAKHHHIVKDAILETVSKKVFYYPLLSLELQEIYVNLYNYIDEFASIKIEEPTMHRIVMKYMQQDPCCIKQFEVWQLDVHRLEQIRGCTTAQDIVFAYHDVVLSCMRYVKQDSNKRYETTRKIDRILLHKYLGLPLFFMIFTFVLLFVFRFSAPWNDVIDYLVHDILIRYLQHALQPLPQVVQHFLLDGIVAGVGGVLVFIPIMACLNFMMSILEESGYMSRISFLLDRFMRVFHLSGKSFVSLLLGFGCNVPAIYATRTLDNEKAKRLSAILIPFMSCGARLPVYVLFASAFFPHQEGLMILSVYGLGIFMGMVFALVFSKVSFMKDDGMYVQELPVYRIPHLRIVLHKVKEEVSSYIKKATGIVLWAMIILWGLSYFPNGKLQESYIAQGSKLIQPLFEPLGFGNRWESIASLPGGIIAKETIVGYYEQILSSKKEIAEVKLQPKEDMKELFSHIQNASKESILFFIKPSIWIAKSSNQQIANVQRLWTDRLAKLRAFSFMVYVLLSVPCIMTLQALYHEYGIKLMLLSLLTMLIVPYVASLFIFQLLSLLFVL